MEGLSISIPLKNSRQPYSDSKNLILSEVFNNEKALHFFNKHFEFHRNTSYITSTTAISNIKKLGVSQYSGIVNVKKVNDVRYINKFFETVNEVLPNSGLYFGNVETYPNRKKALLDKYPPVINWFLYITDTILKRVFPKLLITKQLYFYITKGKGRVISKAETYGRLYSCGFEIVDELAVKNTLYFVAKKVKEPIFDQNPTYGPIIRLKRIGKNGRNFCVFKLRTMHPYSEYLQEYVYNINNLQDGGKIKDDFRITPEGRFLRKFWIDEIPMFLNIIRGEMKLVGVRPLSKHFFNLYDEDLQKARIENKPGFIPPFYVDLPKTMEEIMESERKYLISYKQSPIKTDIKYFFLALKNVLLKGARSN